MGRTIQEATDNLRQVAQAQIIGPRYTAGINRADWQGPASSQQAEANYAAGVQAAVAEGRRVAGIRNISNGDWQRLCIQKGSLVIGQRIIDSIDKYTRNFGPILTAMNQAADAHHQRTASPTQHIQNRMVPVVRAAVEAAGKTYS